MLCNFSVRMLKYFLKNSKKFFANKKLKKNTPKTCILMAVGRVFFSAAPTAQNSPELHFCFINSFIQSSLLRSLIKGHRRKYLKLIPDTSFFWLPCQFLNHHRWIKIKDYYLNHKSFVTFVKQVLVSKHFVSISASW